jgi:hypothetical protein
MPFKLVAGPDGRQFGQVSLEGLVTVEREAGETSASAPLTAIWRPDTTTATPLPSDTDLREHKWLDWVPSLKEANSGIKDPLAVVNSQAAAQVKLCNGELRAANIARSENGRLLAWKFKKSASGAPIVIEQALANAMVLCIPSLTKTIWIGNQSGQKLGLVPPGTNTKVTASLTHLPEIEPHPSPRLGHFDMYYDLVEWPAVPRPADLNLPEHPGNMDTSFGTICPGARP